MKYQVSRRANADIEAICDYIAEDNLDAAEQLDDQIHNATKLMAESRTGSFSAGCIGQAVSILDC